MAFHLCIDLSDASMPATSAKDEMYIIHVKFHGTGRDDYKVEYEKSKSTLLTEYLKQRDGPDFHENLMKLTFNITPADEANNFCQSVLERGIFCRQRSYFYLGHSPEQLKNKSCYLIAATHEDIHELLSKFGDFLEEKNLGKRDRKIAMLFSPLNETMPLAANEYKVEPDIKGGVFNSYTFTDGCGFMSSKFASEVQQILKLDYQPSAVHVRYRGIEGMLIVKDDLAEVKVQFHKSMQKFFTPDDKKPDEKKPDEKKPDEKKPDEKKPDEKKPEIFSFLNVVDYSRPYVNGYLDYRGVMLLAERGVSAQNLESLQDGYHQLLEGICKETAEYFLLLKGEFGLLQEIKENGIDGSIKKHLKLLRRRELDEMEKAAYTRVLVPKSREVFAVCDPLNKLKYGECYFNPTEVGDEGRGFLAGQKFVVTRSPCYHPGDVRVLKMTDERQGYENLRDCLVLPVKGPRPHAFECFGGDLSGNKFFVSWDKNLLPSGKEKPCDYWPTVAAKIRVASANSVLKVTAKFKKNNQSKVLNDREEMQQYFATFSDETNKKIEQLYMKYAMTLGLSSKKCRHLSKMLYQAANFKEDPRDLQNELKSMGPGIPSALPSRLQIDQDPKDASECLEEERGPSKIARPSGEPMDISRGSSTSSTEPLGSLSEEDVGSTREYHKKQPPPENARLSKLNVSVRGSGQSCRHGIQIWKKIDDKAKDFVQRMQRETQKSVV